MHELSIAMGIVEVAAEEARRQGEDVRVVAVHLKLGPLAGVAREALLSAYGLACEGSPLEGSRLVIKDMPITAHCRVCQADQPVVSIQEMCCQTCGTAMDSIVTGRELEVTAMEISDAACPL